ncbi:hypothetical protein F2Q68_00007321 [Brassica cretica]|uniref:COP9 signalosome complex subunit 3 n=1 Tax=Brassica cretica TaxID=69181 RepID=A0A8S9KUN2_BRACR|nr:hypothetical protein F2Q68_00007321 [Brassica cretica]
MSESPQKNRISFKTSKAEETNSRNGSPPASSTMTRASSPGEHVRVAGRLAGELGRDTSQLARSVSVVGVIILHESDPLDFSVSLPKCASTAAQRHLKTWSISHLQFNPMISAALYPILARSLYVAYNFYRSPFSQPYTEVGNCYNEGKISELQAVVVAHSSDFEKDNNLGLVKQAVSSLYKRNILRLTQKYLTLSLQDIANMVQLANAKEAEMHVLQMIQDGQIHALINQKDGMVRFLEDPEQYKTSEMIEVMDSVIQRTIMLSKNLIAMDESLSCDPLYLGKFSVSLPKCASTAAQRHLKTWSISHLQFNPMISAALYPILARSLYVAYNFYRSPFSQPYTEVGNCYNEGKISELQAVVVAHSSDFEKDNNLGLVKQAVSSLYKRNILRLTQKYLTLSLQDIANMVQLANAKEAEMHVLQMIQDCQIHALINQKDGMVRFLEDPEQYKTSEMIEVMDSVIQRTIMLSKNLIAMDESLSCDPLYLGKVGRERQRYDFGEDFDTVPQKFSM